MKMIPLKLSLWFLGFLHFSEATGFYKNFTFTNKYGRVEMNWPEIQNDRIHLNRLSCHPTIQKDKPYTNCIISQETYSYHNPSDIISNKSCTVKFGNRTLAAPVKLTKLASLGENRIIYDMIYVKMDIHSLLEKLMMMKMNGVLLYRKFQIVDMNNCQVINDVTVKVKRYEPDQIANLLVHPDKSGKFDIFYKNSISCENSRVRTSYDRDGNLVDGPMCILDNESSSRNSRQKQGTTFMTFSNDSYFVLDANELRLSGYLVGYMKNDTKKIFSDEIDHYSVSRRVRLSTKYNRIGYCVLPSIWDMDEETTINCKVYDIATTKVNHLSLVHPYDVYEFEILNLKNGDFLTLSGQRLESQKISDDGGADKDDGNGSEVDDDDENEDNEGKRRKREVENIIKLSGRFDKKDYELGRRNFELRQYTNNGTMKGEPIKIKGLACNPYSTDRVNLVENGENRVCASFSCQIQYKTAEKELRFDYQIGTECVELEY